MLKISELKSFVRFVNTLLFLSALAVGCATQQFRPVFEGTRWRLTEFDGRNLSALGISAPVELQLDPATHRVSGSSGVNRIAGTYQIAGKRISFGPLIGTRMAGTPEAMRFELDYLTVLGKVDEWSLTDEKLELRAGPEIMATYLPIPPPGSVVASPAQ